MNAEEILIQRVNRDHQLKEIKKKYEIIEKKSILLNTEKTRRHTGSELNQVSTVFVCAQIGGSIT